MEDNHLSSVYLQGFKKFDDLLVEDLGQFNLIVGDNNVGKTTLLEALLLNENINTLTDSLANIVFNVRHFTKLKGPYIGYFFPKSNTTSDKKKIRATLTTAGKSNLDFLIAKEGKYEAYTFNINGLLYQNGSVASGKALYFPEETDPSMRSFNLNVPYITMGSYYTHELTDKYSEYIQLNVDNKTKFIDGLRVMIPGITGIEVNKGVINESALFIAESGKNDLQPLGMYGDGALKLVRILLSLYSEVTAYHYGRIMVDEIDTGVHYSKLTSFLETVLKICKHRKMQLFATSHSSECIESFTKALEKTDMQDEGRIIRLAEVKSGIKAFTMRYDEFENSLQAESEIR